MPLPVILTITVGLVIGNVIARIVREERFNKHRITITAGVGLGEGLAIVFGGIERKIHMAILRGRLLNRRSANAQK